MRHSDGGKQRDVTKSGRDYVLVILRYEGYLTQSRLHAKGTTPPKAPQKFVYGKKHRRRCFGRASCKALSATGTFISRLTGIFKVISGPSEKRICISLFQNNFVSL